jgi:hypothetical protein
LNFTAIECREDHHADSRAAFCVPMPHARMQTCRAFWRVFSGGFYFA